MDGMDHLRWMGPGLILLALSGCTGAAAQRSGAADRASGESATASRDDGDDGEGRRKLARLERELEVARQKFERARVGAEHAEIAEQADLDKARVELHIAEGRLQTLEDMEAPNRLARAELGVQRAEDGVRDSEEELQQLERMYAGEDFADDTKDIVLERGRRRLMRARRDLELRMSELAVLRERTLPREIAELELTVLNKRRSLEASERARETQALDRGIDLRNAEHAVLKLEEDIAEQHRKLEAGQ